MATDNNDQIARTAISGSAYSVAASVFTIALGIVRTVWLVRILAPEHFGVVAFAMFFVDLSAQIRGFGLGKAYIQRQHVDDKVFATYFTMRAVPLILSLVLLAAFVPFIGNYYTSYSSLTAVLYALIGISFFKGLNRIQFTILEKRMAFQAISSVSVISSIMMTIVAIALAELGFGLWSLVGERATGILVNTLAVWGYYRPRRPRFGWDTQIAKELWRFGIKVWLGGTISFWLDRFDDFWTGAILGDVQLGFYDQAYKFANYPRRVVANPVVSVFFPIFSSFIEVKSATQSCFI